MIQASAFSAEANTVRGLDRRAICLSSILGYNIAFCCYNIYGRTRVNACRSFDRDFLSPPDRGGGGAYIFIYTTTACEQLLDF